jgi:hypothetical protein
MNENDLHDMLHEFVACKDSSGEYLPLKQVVNALLQRYKNILSENIETKKKLYSFCIAHPQPHNKNVIYESTCELVDHLCDLYTQKTRESEDNLRKKESYRGALYTSIDEEFDIRKELVRSFESGTCINLTNKQIAVKLTQQVLDLQQQILVKQSEYARIQENNDLNQAIKQYCLPEETPKATVHRLAGDLYECREQIFKLQNAYDVLHSEHNKCTDEQKKKFDKEFFNVAKEENK